MTTHLHAFAGHTASRALRPERQVATRRYDKVLWGYKLPPTQDEDLRAMYAAMRADTRPISEVVEPIREMYDAIASDEFLRGLS